MNCIALPSIASIPVPRQTVGRKEAASAELSPPVIENDVLVHNSVRGCFEFAEGGDD